MANKITAVFDLDGKGFDSGIKKLRTSVAEAEGSLNKAKVASQGLWDNIKANAGAVAVAGGAALVAFGAKAVAAFQETALEAGKFSDATGLAVEDASRWLEVAGDMGVEASTIEGSFVKLNKAIGSGDKTLEQYGIHLITASDGTADVNQTMLTAIQRIGAIKDPTERAAAAQAAFGKSYKEAAEIIFDNADNVKKKLAEVSDAKVINEKELEKARKFRAAMDDLRDSAEDVSLAVGETLVPVLTDLANLSDVTIKIKTEIDNNLPDRPGGFLGDVIDIAEGQINPVKALDNLSNAVDDLQAEFADTDKAVKNVSASSGQYVESLEHMHQGVIAAAAEHEKLTDALAKSREQANSYVALLVGKWKAAQDAITAAVNRSRKAHLLEANAIREAQDAALSGLDTMYDYESATMDAADAVQAMNEAQADSSSTAEDVRRAQIDAAEAALQQAQAFAQSKGAVDGSTVSAQLQLAELNRLAAKFPELSAFIQGYINALNAIPAVKSTQLVVTANGGVTTKQTIGAGGRLVAGASGAIVNRPTMALIGEAGPEAVVPLDHSPGNFPLPTGGGVGGATYNITVNANGDVVPDRIVDAIKKYERLNGNGWRT